MKTPLTPEERKRKRRGCFFNALFAVVWLCVVGLILYPVFDKAMLPGLVEEAEHNDLKAAEYWLSRGHDPNVMWKHGGTRPLHAAQSVEMVDLLLKYGADSNVQTHDGDTPLHVAARWGKPDIARRLLQAGANPNRKNVAGQTPLDVAREAKNAEAIEVLEKYLKSHPKQQ